MTVGGHGKTRPRRTAAQVEEDEVKEKAKKLAKARAVARARTS